MLETRACPFCGEPEHVGGRFCPKCGNRYPFAGDEADAEPSAESSMVTTVTTTDEPPVVPPPRRRRRAGTPWFWTVPFLLAVLLGVVGLGYLLFRFGVPYLQTRRPEPEIVLAPVANASPSASPAASASPSPALIGPPTALIGERVRVANTDGQGANLRQDASSAAPILGLVPDGTVLEIVGADREADGRTWRNVREPGGATGWIAADLLLAS